MSITLLGALTIAATAVGLMLGKRRLIWVLVAVAPFTRSAAITVGDNALSPFYVVAIPATAAAVFAWLRGERVNHRAMRYLPLFVSWALLVTAVSPTLFAGTPVLNPRGGIDDQVLDPARLDYQVSMLAQAAFLILAAGATLYIAQAKHVSPGILTPAVALGSLLSAARLLPGGPAVLDPIFRSYGGASFNIYEQRHFGVFFEPSYLASFSVAALAYLLWRIPRTAGARRVGLVGVAAVTLLNIALSSAGTAVAATIILIAISMLYYGARFVFAKGKLHPLAFLAPLGLLFILLSPNPVSASFARTISGKIGSLSFESRTTSDLFSLHILTDTWGLGAGLGANRPSSFVTLVLSTVGIVGFLVLAAFLISALRSGFGSVNFRPVAVGLLALLVAKAIAEPDLSTPMLWVMSGVCVWAGTAKTPPRPTREGSAAGASGLDLRQRRG